MRPSPRPVLSIIGAGSVGASLARLWFKGGIFAIGGVQTRSLTTAQEAVQSIGSGTALGPSESLPPSDLVCITTPDDAIAPSSARVMAVLPSSQENVIVFHCSGVLGSRALSGLLERPDMMVASAHPAVSWSQRGMCPPEANRPLCALEGDQQAVKVLSEAFSAVGFSPFTLPTDKKPLYHAALAITSNFTVTLMAIGAELLESCGISLDDRFCILRGLIATTTQNLTQLAPSQALTGPLLRGDVDTIKLHIEALTKYPDILNAYVNLSLCTLPLARLRNPEQEAAYHAIEELLRKLKR